MFGSGVFKEGAGAARQLVNKGRAYARQLELGLPVKGALVASGNDERLLRPFEISRGKENGASFGRDRTPQLAITQVWRR